MSKLSNIDKNGQNKERRQSNWKKISESVISKIIKSLDDHTYNPNLYGLMDLKKNKNR